LAPPFIVQSAQVDAIVEHIDPEKLRLTEIAEQSERDVLTRMKNGEAS